MAKIGLYYPFIHFQNMAWLKLSALYWDRMNRIVPRGYALHDGADVRAFVDSGFVVDEHPDQWASKTGRVFEKLLDEHLAELSPRYDVRRAETWPVLRRRGYAMGRHPHLAYIHARKLPVRLQERLHRACLAVSDPKREWLGMHPHLVRAYMFELARRISASRAAELVCAEGASFVGGTASDGDVAAALIRKLNLDARAKPKPSDPARFIFTLALQTVLPRDLAALPAKRIIELRKDYAPSRLALQAWAEDLAKSLGPEVLRNKTTLRQHVRAEYEKTLAPELKALKAALRRRGQDVAFGAMGLSLSPPALLTLVPSLPATAPVLTFAAGALALAAITHRGQQGLDDVTSSRAAYLLKAQELEPVGLAGQIQKSLRRFTLGV